MSNQQNSFSCTLTFEDNTFLIWLLIEWKQMSHDFIDKMVGGAYCFWQRVYEYDND